MNEDPVITAGFNGGLTFMSSKFFILASLLTAAMSARGQEQTNTTSASASTIEAEAVAATQDPAALSTSMKEQKNILVNLSTENYSGLRNQNTLHSEAPVVSNNAVGLVYKKGLAQFELRQYMEYASNKENLTGPAATLHENAFEMSYLMARAAAKWETTALGSKAINTEFRYYMPTDRLSKDLQRNGIVRADVFTDWNLTPAWNFTAILSPRVMLNSAKNPNAEVGADAEYYRLVACGYLTYNFNDAFGLYYGFSQDQRSRNAQRGTWTNDIANVAIHEIGANWTIGAVTINPVLESDLDQNDGQASILTNQSRYYADDTTSVNLNVYATF